MGSNSLPVLQRSIPIRAIPEKELDAILETKFKFWLANLLSIKADNEEKLDAAFPAIKKHFWSLGMNEIIKAFEMYADGEMSLEPKSNYFDRVLVGQIFNEYRRIKPRPKPQIQKIEPSPEEKERLIYSGLMNCWKTFVEQGRIAYGYSWVYDHCYDLGLLPVHTKEFRDKIKARANKAITERLKGNPIDYHVREKIRQYKAGKGLKIECKMIILNDYFKSLQKKGVEFKDVLK